MRRSSPARYGLGSSLLLYPAGAAEFLERTAPGVRVFNDDLPGGLLLWNDPDRRVFIDGRVQVYPDAVQADWQRVLDDPRTFSEVAPRWGIGAVVLHHPHNLGKGAALKTGFRYALELGFDAVVTIDADGQHLPCWAAHIIEERFAEAQPKPELYRTDSDYVGMYCGLQGCNYVPIEERPA